MTHLTEIVLIIVIIFLLFQPVFGESQLLTVQVQATFLCLRGTGDQLGILQHLQVPRYRWRADVERCCDLAHSRIPLAEASDDGATGGICQGIEDEALWIFI